MKISILLIYATLGFVVFGYTINALQWEGGAAILGLAYCFHILAYVTYIFDKKEHRNRSIIIPIVLMALLVALSFENVMSTSLHFLLLNIVLLAYVFWHFLKDNYLIEIKKKYKPSLKKISWVLFSGLTLGVVFKLLHLQGAHLIFAASGLTLALYSFFHGAFKSIS